MGEKRSAGLESRVFFTWPHICFEVQAGDLLLHSLFFFFWPNKLVNMLFMLCVTPVVSLQMQLCSPLAIKIPFNEETNGNPSKAT